MTRTSKYNVSKSPENRTFDGILFDSALEMRYYKDVVLKGLADGTIRTCELQKPYELQPKFLKDGKTVQPIKYVADFYILYADGREEVIDTKGMPDSVALIKRKLFWYKYPNITYRWVCHSQMDGGWCDFEVVKARRAKARRDKKQL